MFISVMIIFTIYSFAYNKFTYRHIILTLSSHKTLHTFETKSYYHLFTLIYVWKSYTILTFCFSLMLSYNIHEYI